LPTIVAEPKLGIPKLDILTFPPRILPIPYAQSLNDDISIQKPEALDRQSPGDCPSVVADYRLEYS